MSTEIHTVCYCIIKSMFFSISLPLSQTHHTWSQRMFVNSLAIISWPPAVKCLLAQHLVALQWLTIDQTASSLASSVSSALGTCRACAGTTGTAMVARSSSSAKTVPFSPATSKERPQVDREKYENDRDLLYMNIHQYKIC